MNKIEKWKPIAGYESLYEVSSLGRVRSANGKTTYTEKHGERKWKSRIIKPKGFTPRTGHRVTLWKDGEGKGYLVARLTCYAWHENPQNKKTVNHINGDKMDNRVENLEWNTITENINHAFDSGLMPTNKITQITNKETQEVKKFRSMSKASEYMGFNKGYIHTRSTRGHAEDSKYKWKIIPF